MNFFKATARNFGHLVLVLSCLLVAGLFGMASEKNIQADRPDAANSPALVMSECEATVTGVFPTGAVVQKIGGGTYMVRNPKRVDSLLVKALDDKLVGIRVISFCK